jgi:hypothetical protein
VNEEVKASGITDLTSVAGVAAIRDTAAALFARLALAVVPAGTSNGVSATLSRFASDDNGTSPLRKDPFSAMVRLLSRPARPMDILTINGAVTPPALPSDATKWWTLAHQSAAQSLIQSGGVWDLMIGSLGIVSHVDSLSEEMMRGLPKWAKEMYIPPHVVVWKLSFRAHLTFKPVWPIPGHSSDERPTVSAANSDGFVSAKVTGGFNHPGRLPECPVRGSEWRVINDGFVMLSAMNMVPS